MGPGSICTTRVVAGVGVPQISAVLECAAAAANAGVAHHRGRGIKYSRLREGARRGSALGDARQSIAGTEESPGETILYEGRTYKVYQGQGSLSAMSGAAATGTSRKA